MSSNPIVGPHGRDVTAAEAAQLTAAPTQPIGPIRFRDVLDALNPLQYVPVIGTIYRVATGDDGSPTLRTAISLVSGILMGGPVGLLTSMAGEVFGHYFDFEHYARAALVTGKSATVAVAANTVPAATATATVTTTTGGSAAAPAAAKAAPAAAATDTVAVQPATPQLASQAAAAYARFADMPTRIIAGGAQR